MCVSLADHKLTLPTIIAVSNGFSHFRAIISRSLHTPGKHVLVGESR